MPTPVPTQSGSGRDQDDRIGVIGAESGIQVSRGPLKLLRILLKFGLLLQIAPSSNGKTADSGQSSGFRVLRALLPLSPSVDKIVY